MTRLVSAVRFALLSSVLAAGHCLAQDLQPIQPGERPVAGSTEAELWYGMDQAEKSIRSSPLVVHDPALEAYVRKVTCNVAGDHCGDLRVYIIDAPYFNASMAPNGVVLVFTGALLRMQDESELALVLGHEFAHFRQRHSLRFWQKAKRTTAFMATFSIITYGGGVGLAGSLAELAGAASLLSFSRSAEREADHIGFETALRSNYDPQAGVRVWTRMLAEERASHNKKPLPVFASHPRTAERLEDVRAAADGASTTGQTRDGRAEYRQAMQVFLPSWLEAELSKRTFDSSIQMISDLRASSGDSQGLYSFYLAEAYRRRAKNDDRQKAAQLYADAVRIPEAPAAAWREHGLNLRSAGDKSGAANALHEYLRRSPTAADRKFIEQYLSELETRL